MKTLRFVMVISVISISLISAMLSYAYEIPYDNSNVKYFYVFGANGDPLMGAEASNTMEIFIDVPAADPNDVTIGIYDPDTGGGVDWRKPDDKAWDTTCEFSVKGKDVLDSKTFGADPEWDKKVYTFGPYAKEKGEKVGDFYRFTVTAKGLSGDDENLFNVRISPRSAESFSKLITFRLLPTEGDKMYFYPQVRGGAGVVMAENYDMDPDGATGVIAVGGNRYSACQSASGQWCKTKVPVDIEGPGRLDYTLTKETEKYGNAGIKFTDDKGNALPIYFRKGAPPVAKAPAPKPAPVVMPELKCNKFTFDATASYDIEKQKLSYLWDFGDGTTSTEPVVTHIYEKGGQYAVKLTVTDDSGLPCDNAGTSQKVYINTPPKAAFSAPSTACTDETVTLDASGTTDDTPERVTYKWNFGDGATAETPTVTHVYKKGGVYNVTMTADDNMNTPCSTDAIMKTIKVNSAPVADAGANKVVCIKSKDTPYSITFDGSKSFDPDRDPLTYRWSFGDGESAEGAKVTHVYSKGGTYNATLIVDDGSGSACGSSSDSVSVALNRAPIAVAGESKKACAGDEVSFDGSSSIAEPGQNLSYRWSFGDGDTAEGARVNHAYLKGGKHNVVLTVDDGKGTDCSTSSNSLVVDVNSRPAVQLAAAKETCVGKSVDLDSSASDPDGDKLVYSWNFGDGTSVEGPANVNHNYAKGGQYTATVTVDDNRGSACSMASDSVSVKVNTPPSAAMAIQKACCVDMEQRFDASASSDADGDPITYKWNFGDGGTAEGRNVAHVYTTPGTFKVTLVVEDNSGTGCGIGVATDYINVNASPVPVIKIR